MNLNYLAGKMFWFLLLMILISGSSHSQQFPQQQINQALLNKFVAKVPISKTDRERMDSPSATGALQFMRSIPDRIGELQQRLQQETSQQGTDTLFVGVVPNDTVVITGSYLNNGPVLIFNNGVLIFDHANATILGDIYVFQNGKLDCDSSTLFLPQQYFYQRSMIVANNGEARITYSTLDYSGLSHNLAIAHNGQVDMMNITNIGFTTAGVYNSGSIHIDGTNQAGEFIMTDSATFNFSNANTVLLWHHIPNGGFMNTTFPSGASVASYVFNSGQPGVSGVNYDVHVTNCTDVLWALMPEGGSNITISNSVIRAIGLWFTGSDTTNVSGLVDNSSYSSFLAPLSDRILQLNNTSVQTWSLYMFHTVHVNVTGCIVGEVGSMGTSFVTTQSILCDGSGGYYWGNDTSFNIAVGSTVLGYIRSQGNGIVLLGYGSATAGASATGNSIMVVTQSSLPQDPVAFDHGTAWLVQITPPGNIYSGNLINLNGSAWIDQGPLGSFMDFGSYNVEYTPAGSPGWIPILTGNTNEVHNGLLAQWNTQGIPPGTYNLRLNTFNNFNDSIDAVIQVTLLPSVLGIEEASTGSGSLDVYFDGTRNVLTGTFSSKDSGRKQIVLSEGSGRIIYRESAETGLGEQQVCIAVDKFSSGVYCLSVTGCDFHMAKKVLILK